MDAEKGRLPLPTSVFADLVERELASGIRWLRFEPELERCYDDETRQRQVRHMLVTGYAGIAIYDLFLIADYLLVPDIIVLAAIVRLAIVTPISATLLLLFVRFSRASFPRHAISVVIMTVMSAASIFLLVVSKEPERVTYYGGVLLIVIYGCLIHRPQFWFGVAGCVATNAVFTYGLQILTFATFEAKMAIQLIVLTGSVFTLFAAFSMERERRLFYLISLKERLHSMMMEGISNRDALTGMFNRRALDRRLQELAERSSGWQSSLAVIILDIDHFKVYNDRLGHQAGDDCLRQVASLILSMMRDGRDEAFRYGGEEFLLLISEGDNDRAVAFAETIRRAIESQCIPHPASSTGPHVTASLGVAHADATRSTPVDLIARADMALYAAKNGGRNRVWPQITLRSPALEVLA